MTCDIFHCLLPGQNNTMCVNFSIDPWGRTACEYYDVIIAYYVDIKWTVTCNALLLQYHPVQIQNTSENKTYHNTDEQYSDTTILI